MVDVGPVDVIKISCTVVLQTITETTGWMYKSLFLCRPLHTCGTFGRQLRTPQHIPINHYRTIIELRVGD